MASTTLYGQVKSESQHRPAPSAWAYSHDSVSNNNIFQWTEEVILSTISTRIEYENSLQSQYQVSTGKPDKRDPTGGNKPDSVEVAFGV